MADKSPRQSMSKKSGTSIKEKRPERKAEDDSGSAVQRTAADEKH
ncbi:hypothetical protein ACI797_11150 [Geodermatophilus sp. SYSU D00691]